MDARIYDLERDLSELKLMHNMLLSRVAAIVQQVGNDGPAVSEQWVEDCTARYDRSRLTLDHLKGLATS